MSGLLRPSKYTVPGTYRGLPPARDGLAIGLYGGSFNPPHEGHMHVSQLAMRRLGLDRIWWLVTPGNPIKDQSDLQPLSQRLQASAQLADHPRIDITSVEQKVGFNKTRDTIRWLKQRCPRTRFIWIMGADNLAQFHQWYGWRDIAALVPIAVIDRPGFTFQAKSSHAAQALSRFREDETDAIGFSKRTPPAWIFLHGPRSDLSSSALRQGR